MAFILSKNCSQCHNAGSEDDAARFDVGTWIPAPDGRSRIFRHLDDKMTQLSAARQPGPRRRAPVELRSLHAHAERQGDAERRAPGAVPVGAGGAGARCRGRIAAHEARACHGTPWLRSPCCCRRARLAQSSQFKGWAAISRELSTRIAPKDQPLDLDEFLPSESMDDLLGTWTTFGSEHRFRNGVPNALNMTIWHVALSRIRQGGGAILHHSAPGLSSPVHRHPAQALRLAGSRIEG